MAISLFQRKKKMFSLEISTKMEDNGQWKAA